MYASVSAITLPDSTLGATPSILLHWARPCGFALAPLMRWVGPARDVLLVGARLARTTESCPDAAKGSLVYRLDTDTLRLTAAPARDFALRVAVSGDTLRAVVHRGASADGGGARHVVEVVGAPAHLPFPGATVSWVAATTPDSAALWTGVTGADGCATFVRACGASAAPMDLRVGPEGHGVVLLLGPFDAPCGESRRTIILGLPKWVP